MIISECCPSSWIRDTFKSGGLWLLLVSLQFDGGAFAPSDVPHDDGVVWAAGEQHPLDWVPTQRRNVTWGKAQHRHPRKGKYVGKRIGTKVNP